MSGLKESSIQIEDVLVQIALTSTQARESIDLGESLAAELMAAIAGRDDAAVFQELLERLRGTVMLAREVLRRCELLLGAWSRESSDVWRAAYDCQAIVERLSHLRNEVRAVMTGVGIEAELRAFGVGVEAIAERLARWDAGQVDSLLSRCRATAAALEVDMRSGADPRPHRAAVDGLRDELSCLCESVKRRELQDETRDAMIAAICEACRRLAFTIQHEPLGDANAAKRFHINTGAFGILHVELSLDAVLRLDNQVVPRQACEKWVGEFESQMARLGVGVELRYAATGQRVRVDPSKAEIRRLLPASQEKRKAGPC